MGKRKKHEEPVSLPNAHLSGREYAEDRPDNCRDCFFWKKSTDSCTRYECFFLRPLRKKIEERFDENGKLILDCRIWYRPQYHAGRMYKSRELLQVVGHTSVEAIVKSGSLISCDVFSTYRDGTPIGTQEFLIIDTVTWDCSGIRA